MRMCGRCSRPIVFLWTLAFLFSSPILAQNAKAEPLSTPARKSRLNGIFSFFFWGSSSTDQTPAAFEEGISNYVRLSPEQLNSARPWRPPVYSGQEGALAWSSDIFQVPKGMESRVRFWKDIYTKYTSDQGVLHDRDNFDVIYEVVEFGPITNERAREKLVEERRKAVAAGRGVDPKKIRFQLGQKDMFYAGIYHSGRYLEEMEKIFREERLPIELTRIPFVESSFNIYARSKVGASGVWQFMRRTARPYLKITKEVDERNDPIKATRASARLLRQNYQILGSWPLAVTAYNHGANGVRRIVRELGTDNIVEIVSRYSSKTFGFASENFYACFLAALEAEREARKYFREPRWAPVLDVVEIRLRRPMPYSLLVDFFDGDRKAAELANPHIVARVRKGRARVPSGHFIRVPMPRKELAENLQRGKVSQVQAAKELKRKGGTSPATSQGPVN